MALSICSLGHPQLQLSRPCALRLLRNKFLRRLDKTRFVAPDEEAGTHAPACPVYLAVRKSEPEYWNIPVFPRKPLSHEDLGESVIGDRVPAQRKCQCPFHGRALRKHGSQKTLRNSKQIHLLEKTVMRMVTARREAQARRNGRAESRLLDQTVTGRQFLQSGLLAQRAYFDSVPLRYGRGRSGSSKVSVSSLITAVRWKSSTKWAGSCP